MKLYLVLQVYYFNTIYFYLLFGTPSSMYFCIKYITKHTLCYCIYGKWLLHQSHQTSVRIVRQLVRVNQAVRIALESFKRFAYAHPIFNLPRNLIYLNVSGGRVLVQLLTRMNRLFKCGALHLITVPTSPKYNKRIQMLLYL